MRKVLIIILLCVSVVAAQVMTFFQNRVPVTNTLNNGLIAFWKLDETSGTRNDSKGSNHLTDNNTVGYGTGKINNGSDHEHDNGHEFLYCVDNDDLSFGDENMCFSFWYKPESIDKYIMVGRTNADAWGIDWGGYFSSNEAFDWVIGNASGRSSVGTDSLIAAGKWTLVVAWYDTDTDSLYLRMNNGAIKRAAAAYPLADLNRTFRIGGWGSNFGSGWYADGIFDQAGLWGRCPKASNGYAMSDSMWNGGSGWSGPN